LDFVWMTAGPEIRREETFTVGGRESFGRCWSGEPSIYRHKRLQRHSRVVPWWQHSPYWKTTADMS